jgi:MFS family permease
VLSTIMISFTDDRDRTRALAIWSGISAGGGAVGLLLGGVLTDLASWRWIFFVNVPVGAGVLLAALRFVPESRSGGPSRGFDLAGAVSVTAGLVIVVFAIVKAQTYGWSSARTLALLAAGIAPLAVFLAIERRSVAPLMPPSIFRVPGLAADVTLLLVSAAVISTFFFVSLFIQQLLHFRPLRAGLAFLPFSLGIATGATVSRKLVPGLGVRAVALIGLALGMAGMIVLARMPAHGRYGSAVLTGILPLSLGMGVAFVPITLAGTSGITGADSGLASGLFNTAQQVGGSLGLAVLATLAASRTSSLVHGFHRPVTVDVRADRVSGFHVALIGAAALLGVAWIIVAATLRSRPARPEDRASVPATIAAQAAGCAHRVPAAGG